VTDPNLASSTMSLG